MIITLTNIFLKPESTSNEIEVWITTLAKKLCYFRLSLPDINPAWITIYYAKKASFPSLIVINCWQKLIVGSKAKARISKRVLQENKARQFFRKTIVSYPLILTHAYAYHGLRNVCFSENLQCFAFL